MNQPLKIIPFSLAENRNVQLNAQTYLDIFAYRFVSKLKAYFIHNFNLTFLFKVSRINLVTKQNIGINTSEFICAPFNFMPMQQDGMLFFDKSIVNLLPQQKQASTRKTIYIANTLSPQWKTKEKIRFHITSILNTLLTTWQTTFPDTTIVTREMTDHNFSLQLSNELPQNTIFYHIRIYFSKTNFQSFIDLYLNKQQLDTLKDSHLQNFLLHTYKNQATQPYIQEKLNSILQEDITYKLCAVLENKLLSLEDLQKHYKEKTPILLAKPKRTLVNLKLDKYTVATGELGHSNETLSLHLTDTYNNKKIIKKDKISFVPFDFKPIHS